ncbi:MAG: NAD(P)/FAD-dependent oxidoreductase [Bacteroidota bacterium]|nr:NAD(P)/FAD-dependent oxidoreductase [Bacteroidota bacterium]
MEVGIQMADTGKKDRSQLNENYAHTEKTISPFLQTKKQQAKYDIAIIGGGLAGLSLSILVAKEGYSVVLFEKEKYPFHKVCGEYISLEAWDFLETLGIPLSEMDLPIIHKLIVSSPNGKYLEHMLPLGGFGISRYKLDAMMADLAKANGVIIHENTKVNNVYFENEMFNIQSSIINTRSKVTVATFGKRSNLDVTWKRKFAEEKPNKLNNYIGVKYHVDVDLPADQIALHNFNNGYCGISMVEENKYCLCYLTTAKNLNDSNNSIKEMEQKIICKNLFLKNIFCNAKFMDQHPVVISQISFDKKSQVQDHILMVGDAAGMITPLSGNGMSMALHGSKIAFGQIDFFLQKKITRQQMEVAYREKWKETFNKRLRIGRMIQRFFGSPALSNLLINSLKPFPGMIDSLISGTHGQPF